MIYHWHIGELISHPSIDWFPSLVREGETGVTLFMVMSGFILTRISLGKHINYRAFIYNRFVRIYPLYAMIVFIEAYTNNGSMEFASIVQFLSPLANAHNARLPNFSQMWTIPVEFQFYLLFPFLVTFVARYGARYLCGVIFFMVFIRCINYAEYGSIRFDAYWTILGRLDQFSVGMLAAILLQRRSKILQNPVWLIVASALLYAWILVFEHITRGGYYGEKSIGSPIWIVSPAIEAMVWAFFSLSYMQQRWPIPSSIDRTLAFLGSASFSMYAWHLPIIHIAQRFHIAPFHTWFQNFAFVVFPTVTVVSIASFYIVERPFLQLRQAYTKRPNVTDAPSKQLETVK